ncbi:hypothetical protein K0M31_003086, partial [Melipona bicolor]
MITCPKTQVENPCQQAASLGEAYVDGEARGNVNRQSFETTTEEFPRARAGGESLGIADSLGNSRSKSTCQRNLVIALRYELQHCGFIHACVIADGVWVSFAVYCMPDGAKQT